MIETKEFVINDKFKIRVTPFFARKAIMLKLKLLKILTPSFSELVTGMPDGKINVMDLDLSKLNISKALQTLFSLLGDEEKTMVLIDEILSGTEFIINNKDGLMKLSPSNGFDLAFEDGRSEFIHTIIINILKANYPNLLKGLAKGFTGNSSANLSPTSMTNNLQI